MVTNTAAAPAQASETSNKQTTVVAWLVMFGVSMIPDILVREVFHASSAWLLWAKLCALAVAVAAGFMIPALRSVRGFATVLAVLLAAEYGAALFGSSSLWNRWVPQQGFASGMLRVQIPRLCVALVMIAALFLMKRNRRDFFLAASPEKMAQPVWWLAIKNPVTWRVVAPLVAIAVSLGTLVFLVLAARPSQEFLVAIVAALPVVLVFATMNAFSEEMSYRASLLSTLMDAVGERQAIWISAAYFGSAHYYGVPYGPAGVLMAGFLGLVIGEVMVRSRGLLWPWLIHFLQDVMIFSFLAAGTVTAGGK